MDGLFLVRMIPFVLFAAVIALAMYYSKARGYRHWPDAACHTIGALMFSIGVTILMLWPEAGSILARYREVFGIVALFAGVMVAIGTPPDIRADLTMNEALTIVVAREFAMLTAAAALIGVILLIQDAALGGYSFTRASLPPFLWWFGVAILAHTLRLFIQPATGKSHMARPHVPLGGPGAWHAQPRTFEFTAKADHSSGHPNA